MLAIDSKDLVWVFVGYVVLHNVAVLSLASLENCSIPEIFGARNRYTLTAVVREIAAVIATGIGPVVVAAWVAAATGSPIPIMVMLGLYTLVGADRRRLGQGLDRSRPDRPAPRDVTARKPNCHRERNP